MATPNNPRKFSEKIALHNQKQAEETAAFDEVMKDLSITRAARLQLQKTQYLQLGQNRGQYYGGSLPNVNQISSSINLPFQTPFQTSAHDTGRATRHHGLVERVYRDRTRITSPHQRLLAVDKHGRQIDSCPYGSVYLSPPPDTSWRRANSDSALHQSTLSPAHQAAFTGGSQELQPKRVLLLTVPGAEEKAEEEKSGQEHVWDDKKNGSRSKPCKVPGINIFLSPDQEMSGSAVPSAAHNTGGGSLPDLTNVQFPPPLPTPLDPDDHHGLSAAHSAGSLASTHTHTHTPSSQGGTAMQARQDNMAPLITNADASQLSPSQSPPHSLGQAVAMDTMTLEQQLSQYAFFNLPISQNQDLDQDQDQNQDQDQDQDWDQSQTPPGLTQLLQQLPCLNSDSQIQTSYRSRIGSSANHSPTSPVSNQGFSPGGSPQHSILGSVFSDFYDQHLSSRQTSALSQQLEQFNMDSSLGSASLYGPASTLNYAQAAMMGLTGSHGNLQDSPQLDYSNHGNIPNIILTVTEESAGSLAKEFGGGSLSSDVSFDVDGAFPLDELRIDPLTLDGLHMLNDPDMVLADPATEDAFRLDRL